MELLLLEFYYVIEWCGRKSDLWNVNRLIDKSLIISVHFKIFFVSDEGVYNTYVLDSDYTSWALLLHCAEKSKVPRYLSSFIMSREPVLGVNVISYLRDKLPKYDIDLSYMFDMQQENCNETTPELPPSVILKRPLVGARRHPMKHVHGA